MSIQCDQIYVTYERTKNCTFGRRGDMTFLPADRLDLDVAANSVKLLFQEAVIEKASTIQQASLIHILVGDD